MPALLADDPSFIYLIVGDGDDQARLQAKAQRWASPTRSYLPGLLKKRTRQTTCVWPMSLPCPGRGEGFGIVYLEALACGVPAVGSQLDGSREALRGGELGELADPADPVSVRACILRALNKVARHSPGLSYFRLAPLPGSPSGSHPSSSLRATRGNHV